MMKRRAALYVAIIFAALSVVFYSCSKNDDDDSNEGTAQLSLRMTDAPGNYDAVYVDIQGVEVKGSGGGTTMLNVNAGVYNLLDFVNGADTLIANGGIPAGKVEQIRLILGSNNKVMVDSVLYPLATPSAQQSGLKLQVHKTFSAGVSYMLLLDFDAQQSIVEQGNGSYSLKPVIRIIDATALNGSITGIIAPINVITSVTADNNSGILYSTFSDSTGGFFIAGVPAGSYNLYINPPAPYQQDTVYNVAVVNGQVTNVGVIQLQ